MSENTQKPVKCRDCGHTAEPGIYIGADSREPCAHCGGTGFEPGTNPKADRELWGKVWNGYAFETAPKFAWETAQEPIRYNHGSIDRNGEVTLVHEGKAVARGRVHMVTTPIAGDWARKQIEAAEREGEPLKIGYTYAVGTATREGVFEYSDPYDPEEIRLGAEAIKEMGDPGPDEPGDVPVGRLAERVENARKVRTLVQKLNAPGRLSDKVRMLREVEALGFDPYTVAEELDRERDELELQERVALETGAHGVANQAFELAMQALAQTAIPPEKMEPAQPYLASKAERVSRYLKRCLPHPALDGIGDE